MKMTYGKIRLRDMVIADIADELKWQTEEVAWCYWDDPNQPVIEWNEEMIEEERRRIIAEFHELERISRTHAFRVSLEIDTQDGVHIGSIDSYSLSDGGRAIGIAICEPEYWGRGYGTDALTAYMNYHVQNGVTELYLETWTGNERMLALAQRLGFREIKRLPHVYQIKGQDYDDVTLRWEKHIN